MGAFCYFEGGYANEEDMVDIVICCYNFKYN